MTWNMLGTIFSGALVPGYVRRGQRHNPPIRDDGLRSREHGMATWGYLRKLASPGDRREQVFGQLRRCQLVR
jgi:hypothetical protein